MNRKLLYGCALTLMFSAMQAQTQIGENIKGATGDYLGNTIALSSAGNIMALGTNKNAVKVMRNENDNWVPVSPDIQGPASSQFGKSIALSADGSILAVGIPYAGKGEKEYAGAVQILKNTDGTWNEIGYIEGKNATDNSGSSVALSVDGTIVAIAATSTDEGGQNSGSIRVFKNISGVWTQIGDTLNGEASNNDFGRSLSISADGSVVAAGAPFNSNGGVEVGNVRVFKNIDGVWTKIGKNISGATDDFMFGGSVSLSGDGNTVAIGGNRYPFNGDNFNRGHVLVYRNKDNKWLPMGSEIIGDNAGDALGQSVSLSRDGTILAVGAVGANNGQVRIYQYLSTEWGQVGEDINGQTSGELTGSCVALSANGKLVVTGAPYNSENGEFANNGMVRAYGISPTLASDTFVLNNTSIYPNPASHNLYVNLQQDLNLKEINIYSVLGQLMKSESNNVINVSNLEKGLYLVQVVTDRGSSTQKIIVE